LKAERALKHPGLVAAARMQRVEAIASSFLISRIALSPFGRSSGAVALQRPCVLRNVVVAASYEE